MHFNFGTDSEPGLAPKFTRFLKGYRTDKIEGDGRPREAGDHIACEIVLEPFDVVADCHVKILCPEHETALLTSEIRDTVCDF
jgi:hypothetical protein